MLHMKHSNIIYNFKETFRLNENSYETVIGSKAPIPLPNHQ